MSIVCKAFIGWEIGSPYESDDVIDDVAVGAGVAPASPKETYTAAFGWKTTARTPSYTLGSDWITATFYIRFTNIAPDSETLFAWFEDSSGYCWQLKMTAAPSSGQIKLYDAGGGHVASFSGPVAGLPANTWYRIQVKFKHADSTDLQVWLDDALVLDLAAFDASSGGATGWLELQNPVDPLMEANFGFYASHMSILEDDGGSIDTERTAPADYFARVYQNTTHTGVAPDVGDNLDAANAWSDAGDTPGNDATDARYSIPGNSTREGYVYTDGGPRAGPSGDADLQDGGKPLGLAGTWRVANGVGGFKGRVGFTGLLGTDDGPAIVEFAFGSIPPGTNPHNYHAMLDAAEAEYPSLSDHAAIGVKGVMDGRDASRLDTFDMWACVLYREPRRVCIDGLITLVP